QRGRRPHRTRAAAWTLHGHPRAGLEQRRHLRATIRLPPLRPRPALSVVRLRRPRPRRRRDHAALRQVRTVAGKPARTDRRARSCGGMTWHTKNKRWRAPLRRRRGDAHILASTKRCPPARHLFLENLLPAQLIQFTLIQPCLRCRYQPGTNGILSRVFPLLIVVRDIP